VLKKEWLPQMADKPLIMALANPNPEILPEVAKEARPDAIIATGRSDHPNQVNNVLCFPFVFRGALDVDAVTINEPMKVAAAIAIADLARAEGSDVAAEAYEGAQTGFGKDYIIPRPFDPRLILHIAPAVAKAAMESGVARRPIADFEAYERELQTFVYRSGQLMRPVFEIARRTQRSVVYAEGEEERILRAVQTVVDEKIARPTLIGRKAIIQEKAHQLGLRMDFEKQATILDPDTDEEIFGPLRRRYSKIVERRGVTPDAAARWLRTRRAIAAAIVLEAGLADAALCGGLGDWIRQYKQIAPIIPHTGVNRTYSLSALILPNGVLFFCDTHLNMDPTADQVAEMTILAARAVRRFGLKPKAALLSHSTFGASAHPSARKMREALAMIHARAPDLEVDGEMHADAALSEALRGRLVSSSPLKGSANLLIMPTLDAANIALTLLTSSTGGLLVGPMLLGMSKPIHVMVPSVTARGIVNMTALACAQVGQTDQ
jgi:malate dehydrogenase (oxaloacetate-decarboxylating)(NADP+)